MSLTETILGFAHQHPSLILVVVFLSAMAEAIVIIGALVPGSAIIIILAGFVGAAHGRIFPLVLAATAGAILADVGSFWVGRRYGTHLREIWPFRLRPDLIEGGASFFERHGGKSVLFGRFLPGVRAVIPVAAGMLGMEAPIFFAASIVSAVAWASIHIIPAAGAGVVLVVVGRISGRLIGAALAFLVLLALAAYAARLVANVLAPHLITGYGRAIAGLARARNPFLKRLGGWLDPARANLRAHILWGIVLLASTVGVIGIARDLMTGDPLVRADAALSQIAQSMRTVPLDRAMVFIAAFGGAAAIAAAVAVLLATLLAVRARRTATVVGTVFLATLVFVPLIRFAFSEQRPLDLYPSLEAFSFPSSQATFAALFCGVLAVLATPALNATTRVLVWAIGLLIAGLIGVARIYLNAHWPSDVFAGLLIGLALTAVFAIIVIDFQKEVRKPLQVVLIAFAGFLLAGAVNGSLRYETDLVRYAPKPHLRETTLAAWRDGGWRRLPARRSDIFGETEETIVAQIAADPDAIAAALETHGWHRAEPFSAADILFFLVPNAPLDTFPPLPLMHGGRLPALTLVNGTIGSIRRRVLRLWPSDLAVSRDGKLRPILLASVTDEHVSHPYDALTILSDRPLADAALARLGTALAGLAGDGFSVESRTGARGPLLLISRP